MLCCSVTMRMTQPSADVAFFFVVRSLEQLLVSLQWGRQQTYYPSAQPLSTGELAAANHKLADAINSHLLGNTSSSSTVKSSSATAEQLCSTPAEKMAEKVKNRSVYKFPFLKNICHKTQRFTNVLSVLS